MVVDLIGIYGLKGPYCTLTTTDWFLQALSVIPRGSWGDVARRFTMIRSPRCMHSIGSIATLDLPMVVDLIGIYGLKGPYCTLTTTDWFLQALSVIPRGSWGDVARRFTMIRSAALLLCLNFLSLPSCLIAFPTSNSLSIRSSHDQHAEMLARLEELEAHRAREEGEAKARREALEAQLAVEKEAHEVDKVAWALLEAELEEVKARAGQEAERLKIEFREEFLKSSEFDTLLGKKVGGYFKNGFRGCLAQWRANGYSEEEHPASFLDVQQAIIEMADEEEEGEEEEEDEGDGTDATSPSSPPS
ncbi:hypothetical protein F511_06699 [Dorcoceras hygrometricum]|uniref:Uncharacterized protein n=1 Tax=Dorcoceras hygrometricum TaxID=472368 RepID=A0A2Z7BAF9_9LAMI|nr:hypothetical protein F511_06699 [Dorcoceras hygrometricum]